MAELLPADRPDFYDLDDRDLPSWGPTVPEGDYQINARFHSIGVLRHRYRHRADVYVSGDMFIHYPTVDDGGQAVWKSVAPDVFVVFGAPKRGRRSYVRWKEPKAPDFVLEILSPSTHRRDREEKPEIYAAMGVREYFLYDPEGMYLASRVQGFELHGGEYRALPAMVLGNGRHGVLSTVLDLGVYHDPGGGWEEPLRWHDPGAGASLPTWKEEAAAGEAEAVAREAETAAREAAEAEVAELRALVRKLGGSPP